MAIDRQFLVDHFAKVSGSPSYSVIPKERVGNYKAQPPDWSGMKFSQQLAKAKSLFEEAGYGPMNPLKLELRTIVGEIPLEIASTIAAMWQHNLGIDVKVVPETTVAYLNHRQIGSDLQIFWFRWSASYPDMSSLLSAFQSQAQANDFHYNNPIFDGLLEQSNNIKDDAQRVAILQRAESTLVSENVVIPLFTQKHRYLVKPWVKGFRLSVIGDADDQIVAIKPHSVN
jgi:oligopeptide transport system substrate-binding protein